MANIELHWTKTPPIRLNEYAYDMGFILNKLEQRKIPELHEEWIYNKIIGSILYDIFCVWEEEWEVPLSSVDKGLYVITLADKLSIDYDGFPSPVLYIGRGQLYERIRRHLWNWIRYFSETLQGISFHFWMTQVKVRGLSDAFMDVESDLLNDFCEKYSRLPIHNSRHGRKNKRIHDYYSGWNKPLWNPPYINSGWSIKPLPNNWWAWTET